MTGPGTAAPNLVAEGIRMEQGLLLNLLSMVVKNVMKLQIKVNPETHFLVNRLRSNSSCSVPSTPDQHTKFYRKRESSLTPTHLHPKFGIDRSNSTNLLNLTDKSAIATRGRSPRQRRGAICNEGSISFFNK